MSTGQTTETGDEVAGRAAEPSSGRWWQQVTELDPRRVAPGLADVLGALPGDVSRLLAQTMRLRAESTLANPPRWLLASLRILRPRIDLGRVLLLTRADDVRAVLADHERYRVTAYGAVMTGLVGPFALGLDGEEHTSARGRLAAALTAVDPDGLAAWADRTCARLVAEARSDDGFDLVSEYAVRLPTRFVVEVLGISDQAPGCDETWLAAATHDIFEACFLNGAADRGVSLAARRAVARLRAVVADAVAQAGEGPAGATVLDRLVDVHGPTPEGRRQAVADVIGLAVAAVATTAEALVRVVDSLLDDPDRLGEVRAAYLAGDRDLVAAHLRETLRFNPQSPALLRMTTQPGDKPIAVSTLSAMHDPVAVDCPARYRTDRPEDTYLHFGLGRHRCLGEPYAVVMLVSGVGTLLRSGRLRRAEGEAGRLATTGPFPSRLEVAT